MTARQFLVFVTLWLAIFPLAPRAWAETPGRRYALLIGVSAALRPGVPRLNFVDNDVEQLGRLLKRQGYDIRIVPNDRADRRRILEELYRHALTLREQDTFVLYYAGHGVRNVEVNRKTYWLTDDADLAMLDVQGIRLEHLLSYVDDIRATRKLVLLDHCFSGDVEGLRAASVMDATTNPAGSAALGAAPSTETSPRVSRGATVVNVIKGELTPRDRTTVIAAARDEAYELQKIGHGVFTKALLDACDTSRGASDDDKRSILELIQFLQPQVDSLLKEAKAPEQRLVDKLADEAASVSWNFCVLPIPAQKIPQRTGEYNSIIQEWETKGFLSALARVAASEVLEKWKNGGGVGDVLNDREHRILVAIRLFADPNENLSEQLRAESLADALRREGY